VVLGNQGHPILFCGVVVDLLSLFFLPV
jgi:hypothetical protein